LTSSRCSHLPDVVTAGVSPGDESNNLEQIYRKIEVNLENFCIAEEKK
jgi:hypothetical protein